MVGMVSDLGGQPLFEGGKVRLHGGAVDEVVHDVVGGLPNPEAAAPPKSTAPRHSQRGEEGGEAGHDAQAGRCGPHQQPCVAWKHVVVAVNKEVQALPKALGAHRVRHFVQGKPVQCILRGGPRHGAEKQVGDGDAAAGEQEIQHDEHRVAVQREARSDGDVKACRQDGCRALSWLDGRLVLGPFRVCRPNLGQQGFRCVQHRLS